MADQPLRAYTTIFLDYGEEAAIAATTAVELIPRDFVAQPQGFAAVAAE